MLLCYTSYGAEDTRHLVTGNATKMGQSLIRPGGWRTRLTLKTSGCGYDVKDAGQNAQGYTNHRDVVVAVLFGHTLAIHGLAQ